jgi:hypothetical protein
VFTGKDTRVLVVLEYLQPESGLPQPAAGQVRISKLSRNDIRVWLRDVDRITHYVSLWPVYPYPMPYDFIETLVRAIRLPTYGIWLPIGWSIQSKLLGKEDTI